MDALVTRRSNDESALVTMVVTTGVTIRRSKDAQMAGDDV